MKNATTNPRRSRYRRLLILLSIIAAFSVLFCLFLVYHLFFSDLFRESRVLTVPDLVGVVLRDDLPHEITDFQTVRIGTYSDAPAGTVLSQSPAAGSRRKAAKEGAYVTLTLYVSKGRESVSVPDVVELPLEKGVSKLITSGFSYEIEERFSAVRSGTILSQSVAPNTLSRKGETIHLTVSRGEANPMLRVPPLFGLTLTEARSLLEANELRVGPITYRETENSREEVLVQLPLHGTRVPRGTAIALTVAQPRPYAPRSNGENASPSDPTDAESGSLSGTNSGKTTAPPDENKLEDLLDRLFGRQYGQ